MSPTEKKPANRRPQFVLELALRGNFAFIKAWKGDRWGNLIYRKEPLVTSSHDGHGADTSRRSRKLVELGTADSNHVHTPAFSSTHFQGSK